MKRILLTLIPILMGAAAVPPGYEHWNGEQFVAHEEALHKSMKNGLASETLGNWGNHLRLKTRREASSGQAELHEKLADLIVVQSGHAAIVIGGRILDGQMAAPDEIRGTLIDGGERQSLNAGDILHIPAKTPHQVLVDSG